MSMILIVRENKLIKHTKLVYQQFTTFDVTVVVQVVTQPGPGVVIRGSRPPDYFIPSIFACFCFWPTGLAAIYYSMQVCSYVCLNQAALQAALLHWNYNSQKNAQNTF